MPKSQNGFAVDPPLAVIKAAGHAATVRKGNVARLIRWLGILYDQQVEPIKTFNGYRSAAGNAATGTPVSESNHRSGTAIDINGTAYPYEYTHRAGWTNRMTAAKQAAVRKILKQAPEIRWGADFTSPYRDPMHYEIAPGISAAKVKARVKALGIGWYTVKHGSGVSTTKAALYTGPKVGKITRRRTVGKRLYVTAIIGGWACTKHGDWIKLSKIKKAK